jgi:CBS domain-containing protein
MKKNVKFVSEGDSLGEASETMTVERHRHLPVLRDGKLVGIISIGDVVKHRIEACEAEHLALRQYIASA